MKESEKNAAGARRPASPPCEDAARPSPEEPRSLASLEEEQEETLFRHIIAQARDPKQPLRLLSDQARALCNPHAPPSRPEGRDDNHASWHNSMDRDGNPAWISLSLPQREEEQESAAPKDALPEESAAPSSSWGKLPFSITSGKDSPRKNAGKHAPVAGSQSIAGRFFSKNPEQPDTPAARILREREGKGSLTPRKARPLRGFFRILLITAILAMIYHILAQQGWVPPLF